jgi:hypothetical protein
MNYAEPDDKDNAFSEENQLLKSPRNLTSVSYNRGDCVTFRFLDPKG